jgi:hypothetical protein
MRRFAELPDARLKRMGSAARQWIEQDFTATAYRNRLLALYGTLPGQA